MTYIEWIEKNVPNTYGTCREVTRDMLKAFPELRRVRGYYHCFLWGEREHWWLVNGDEIVDPTKKQFPSQGDGVYVEMDEDAPEPTGMCPNCGEYCYDGNYCCTDACMTDFLTSLRGPL